MSDHPIRAQETLERLANKIEEIARRSWNGSDARAIKQAATILRSVSAAQQNIKGEE